MLITRNNYETFFLLYADNELCAEERLAVESYVAVNEDLRGELTFVIAAILPADDCTFTQKESLYKNSFINGSLQEKLFLKIDNELSAEELTALNKIVLANQSAVQEEQLLLATKLDALDTIIYPYTELLYIKERDKVVVFRMIRGAAAAILVGFGLFFGISVYNKNSSPDNTVGLKEDIKRTNRKLINTGIKEEQNVAVVKMDSDDNAKENNKSQNVKASTNFAVNKKDKTEKGLKEKITVVEQNELAFNKEVQKKASPTVNTDLPNVSQSTIISITKAEKVKTSFTNENMVPLETIYAQAISFTEIEKGNNKIFYIDEDDVKRSKVGGIFKKFKRMIERTAKIKIGNPIRIAGFEIGSN
jgi:hypothetical protein